MGRRGRPTPADRLCSRRCHAVAESDRRRDDRSAGPHARRHRRKATCRAGRALRTRPAQEGPHLLQRQPAEGLAGLRLLVAGPAAAPRRAEQWPGPVDGEHLSAVRRRSTRSRRDGPAVQSHPGRDRGTLRAGDDHPRRQDRRERDTGIDAASQPHDDHSRLAQRPRRSHPHPRRRGRQLRRDDAARPRRQRGPRRTHPGARRHRRAQPGQPAAHAGGTLHAPLRRRRSARAERSRSGAMTTALERPHHPAHEAPQHGSAFTGTLGMLRLYLRRDRIVLPLWVLLLSTPLATVYIGGIEKVYPDQAARAGFAATIMASPAQRALYGKIYNDSLGATGIWKAGMFHLLIAVAVILTVIRHTRADEETGRAELVDSTAVGRYASLTAALLLSFGASLLTGALGAAGLLGTSVPADGSLAFGAALACSGLVFTAVAAVATQLSASARFARGAAFAVLATAFTLRAVGDAGSPALSWVSPLGWSLQVRPYAGDRWWVLLLHLATTVLLTTLAYRLLVGRDVGAGLVAERPGPATATPLLRNAFGLAWRLERGTLLLWTVGLCLYGLLIGSVVHDIGDEIGGTSARDIVVRMGGTNVLEQAFVAAAFCMLGMMAAAFAVSLTLRLHQEEADQRAETLLSGAVSRSRWLASHLGRALMGWAGR